MGGNARRKPESTPVEACVAAYAAKFGQDEATWSVTALLHDFDYEMAISAQPLEKV